MSRKTTNIVFPVVLKTIVSHTHRDDKSFARSDKQIRATLRAKLADAHVRNTSWIATNMREYNAIRTAYDARYAASLTRPARASRKRSTPSNADAE